MGQRALPNCKPSIVARPAEGKIAVRFRQRVLFGCAAPGIQPRHTSRVEIWRGKLKRDKRKINGDHAGMGTRLPGGDHARTFAHDTLA